MHWHSTHLSANAIEVAIKVDLCKWLLNFISFGKLAPSINAKRLALLSYFTFLPAIEIAGFPALEFAVAETFGFSCFGFLASLLLFLPLAIVCPSKM
ncbi:hypothetical protein SAMN04488001_1759 [Litoreibacter albidus]|uniref:Uncharacterized protein n=1 Tax=Litoreibacter albidus TaxID=670155 RepID=A0A1H2W8N4_9RHOB|nr:hypothetical protein SAMN04488001_1759 [Litoreibacter albidus]